MILSATDGGEVHDIRNPAARKFMDGLSDRVAESPYNSHVISTDDSYPAYTRNGLYTLAQRFVSKDSRSMFALYRMTMNDTESFVQSGSLHLRVSCLLS